MKVWEHQEQLRSRDALRAWLTQTVIRECLSVCRRRRTEGRALERQSRVEPAWEKDDSGRGEHREKVLASVAELDEPVRTVVILRLLEGMSGSEVKEVMQCSAAKVSRQLHEGMEILRRKLRDYQETAGEI